MKTTQIIENKIYERNRLAIRCNEWKNEGKKIVFTNGCFDILHQGHLEYLSQAADLGDILIIGLNTDNSVRKLKGKDRPINHETSRAMLLASLLFVDAVVLFDEDTPYELIRELQPHIIVKGGDYHADEVVGADIVKINGGKVVILPFVEGFSTSGLIEKLRNL